MRRYHLAAVLGAGLLLPTCTMALTITSGQAGNLYVDQQPMKFTVKEAKGRVSYRLTDYWSNQVSSGTSDAENGTAMISFKGYQPGWYQLTVSDDSGSKSASIGVVMDRKGAPLSASGRLGADAASAWLLKSNDQRVPFAQVVKLAGIPWIRERLRWSGLQPQQDKYNWSDISQTVNALSSQGVHIFEVWHDTPGWARANKPDGTSYPADLRDVYKFTKQMAKTYGSKIEAYEPWNESDIGFWNDLSDRSSGYFKAAYLGLKAGNPAATVTQGSLCVGPTSYSRGLYQNGVQNYFEVFNWHRYATPSSYPDNLAGYRKQLKEYHLDTLPAWMTEAGIALRGQEIQGDGKGLLSASDEKLQAEFIPQSAAMSLIAGNERHFFFVIPEYLENGTQFGILKPDLSPNPGFIALSTVANMLGEGTYLGQYPMKDGDINCRLFKTPKGLIMICWSAKPTTVSIPVTANKAKVMNIFGSPVSAEVLDGAVPVKIGPEAVYVMGVDPAITKKLTGVVIPRAKMPVIKPQSLILCGHSLIKQNKGRDCYTIEDKDTKQFTYTVEVYNFSQTASEKGSVTLSVPKGWSVANATRNVKLAAMGRQVLEYIVKPGASAPGIHDVKAVAKFGARVVSPVVSHFEYDLSTLTPKKVQDFDLYDASRWKSNISAGDTVTVTNPSAKVLQIDSKFSGNHDRWSYPYVDFDKTIDISGYDAVGFDLECSSDGDGSMVRMMMVETPGDTSYMTGVAASKEKKHVVLTFDSMAMMIGADSDGKLTLSSIKAIRLGCNTKADRMILTISNIQLIKF